VGGGKAKKVVNSSESAILAEIFGGGSRGVQRRVVCFWGGRGVGSGRCLWQKEGVGLGAREGDDAVSLKTGLIFGRTIIFGSVTFFEKLFQPIKSPGLIGRFFVVQWTSRKAR
jgi:hypothetical protein